LVNTILSNNGYTVFDLGKQVPVNTIIDKALEVGADAIGLSALLVSTSKQMPLCVQELDRRGLKIPVMIGGAAINRRFGRRALFVEGERAYNPVPTAPFFGTRTLKDVPLDEVFALLDLDELYRLQWGARGSGPEFEQMVRTEFRPTLERLEAAAKREGWLKPRALYGFFPVQADGNDLVVYDPEAYAADGT